MTSEDALNDQSGDSVPAILGDIRAALGDIRVDVRRIVSILQPVRLAYEPEKQSNSDHPS